MVLFAVTSKIVWAVPDDEKIIVAMVVLNAFSGIAWDVNVALAKVPFTDDTFGDGQSPVLTDTVALVTV